MLTQVVGVQESRSGLPDQTAPQDASEILLGHPVEPEYAIALQPRPADATEHLSIQAVRLASSDTCKVSI